MVRIFFFCGIFFFGLSLLSALAQSRPSALLTWEAKNYTPPDYPGRHLATKRSLVSVSAELIQDGRLTDIRQAYISWFLDGKLREEGLGFKEFSFPVTKGAGREHEVRATLRTGVEKLEKRLLITSSRPEVVIEHAYSQGALPRDGEARFRALPYFFATPSPAELKVAWTLNDVVQTITSGIEEFLVNVTNLPEGNVRLGARVADPSAVSETRGKTIRLFVP